MRPRMMKPLMHPRTARKTLIVGSPDVKAFCLRRLPKMMKATSEVSSEVVSPYGLSLDFDQLLLNIGKPSSWDLPTSRPSVVDVWGRLLTKNLLFKRGLEYVARAPVFYGNLREKTVFHENLQEAFFVLT